MLRIVGWQTLLNYYQVCSSDATAATPAGPVRPRLVYNTTSHPPNSQPVNNPRARKYSFSLKQQYK